MAVGFDRMQKTRAVEGFKCPALASFFQNHLKPIGSALMDAVIAALHALTRTFASTPSKGCDMDKWFSAWILKHVGLGVANCFLRSASSSAIWIVIPLLSL